LSLDLARDEKRVAVELIDAAAGTGDIWMFDVATRMRSRLTFDPAWDFSPQWSPDGTRIVFGSIRGGLQSLFETTVNKEGADDLVLKSDDALGPTSWSSDDLIVYQNMSKYKVGLFSRAHARLQTIPSQSAAVEGDGRVSSDGGAGSRTPRTSLAAGRCTSVRFRRSTGSGSFRRAAGRVRVGGPTAESSFISVLLPRLRRWQGNGTDLEERCRRSRLDLLRSSTGLRS
jgi:Tol biopolymer transport system component